MDHAHSIFQVSISIEFCASIYPTSLPLYSNQVIYQRKGRKALHLQFSNCWEFGLFVRVFFFAWFWVFFFSFFLIFLLKVKRLPILTPINIKIISSLFSSFLTLPKESQQLQDETNQDCLVASFCSVFYFFLMFLELPE